ncbi:MAG TPA: hypothetical protein PK604_02390 [Acetivibrio clariflavus]|nr:hypothetical protein [Acetivibrio clariflavus]HPU42261.1 hypothetical protein [Acetivibrio clariflavus]
MYDFSDLKCYNCKSIILSLPPMEIEKLNGLNFHCDCCGHQNLLQGFKFVKNPNIDPYINVFSIDNFILSPKTL